MPEEKPRIRYKEYKIAKAFGHTTLKQKTFKPKIKPVIANEKDREIKYEIMELERKLDYLKGIEILNLRPLTPKEKARMVLLEGKIKVLKGQLAKKEGEK
ncbi:MAG: hypothetical protein QW717_06550 [Candidatus Bathyarchaeia archaeon]